MASTAGLAKLEPRFLVLLQERGVSEPVMIKIADSGCCEVEVYSNIATPKEKVQDFSKQVIGVDPSANAADFIVRCKLLTVWESCNTRIEVESKSDAERQISNFPPQLIPDDYVAARTAFEASQATSPESSRRT